MKKEHDDVAKRNFELRDYILKSKVHLDRISIIKNFLNGDKSILDIGCGGFMPKEIGATHACDKEKIAEDCLRKMEWHGDFKVALATELPYKDKEFDCAVMSEVIEHLKNKKDVIKAFNEIVRVSKNWIVTTPAAYDNDPDHKFHFGYNDDNLFELLPKAENVIVIRKGYYYYISNNAERLCVVTGVKNG